MIYFISDIHLGVAERHNDVLREDLLLKFLAAAAPDCECLVIAGDLFDYWFEYKTVIPKYYYRTLTALYNLKKTGKTIEYIMGNHDFGHRDFFENELGIAVHREDISREYFGKKFYISHGDGKALNDTGYLILKKILRNNLSQKLFSLLHPDIGIGMASSSSRGSRTYTDKKDYGTSDGLVDFAKKKIDEGYDYVVMGHRHRAAIIPHAGGFYCNIGDWMHRPTYACFDGSRLELRFVDEFIV